MTPYASPPVSPRKQHQVRMTMLSFLAILAVLLTACGNSTGASQSSQKHVLTIGAHVGGDYTEAFSPYNPTQTNEGIEGMVYETLLYESRIDGKITDLLATSYQWSSDQKQLTFTLRQGVKWSDDKPFTANDVAFTFNMLKKYPAADFKNGVWNYLSSVVATNDSTVVMTFKKAYPPALWYIGGGTFIVPQHIFQNVDPTKFNGTPVGTGPFTLTKFSPQLLVYKKNPTYWDASQVKVDELDYPAVKDNNTLQLELIRGEIDWASIYAPDLDGTFVKRDPTHNHYWMTPTDMVTMYVNLSKAPFNDVNVRQAISAALDRSQLAQQGESGYVAPANTTGLILPNAQKYLEPQFANPQVTANPTKADQILQSDGYTKGSDGIYAKNGQKLAFGLDVVNGWTDWETMAAIIKQDLKNVGMDVTINDIQDTSYYDARNNGNYDTLIGGLFGGPSPFYLYDVHLNSANLSPKGYNWGKWNDPTTDKLLQEYISTTDAATQMKAIQGIETIYAEQLPNIPLVNGASWYEYTTNKFTGWPSQTDQYAAGATYDAPEDEIIIQHLQPVQ